MGGDFRNVVDRCLFLKLAYSVLWDKICAYFLTTNHRLPIK
ncbi:MAG: hypothetical protein ACI9CO_000158 [Candidatus Azotimanducaceae bacterium]|jgi:hypothetical protein